MLNHAKSVSALYDASLSFPIEEDIQSTRIHLQSKMMDEYAKPEKKRKTAVDLQVVKHVLPETNYMIDLPVPEKKSKQATAELELIKPSELISQQVHFTKKPEWHAPWKLMRVISGHMGWVRSIAVDVSNEWFATGSADRLIKVNLLN